MPTWYILLASSTLWLKHKSAAVKMVLVYEIENQKKKASVLGVIGLLKLLFSLWHA